MKRVVLPLLLMLCFSITAFAQSASISGELQEPGGSPVSYANVSLHSLSDSNLIKIEASNEAGHFRFLQLEGGDFFLKATYVGFNDLVVEEITLVPDQNLDLGNLSFAASAVELEAATVTATRAVVEVKPDRTVFNVQGTINSAGQNAIELLRKAPGVLVDNNDNISVLSRSGVLVYVDGKKLPLTGDDLTNYLQNLPAEQIDHIDIITSPGAKYEAEGNAGIIDLRLKKDKNLGANGSLSGNFSQGFYARGNLNSTGNFRNKKMNVFGNAGYSRRKSFWQMDFISFQNQLQLAETFRNQNPSESYDYRIGSDFFINNAHTIGFLVGGRKSNSDYSSFDRIEISPIASPNRIDSVLIADNNSDNSRNQNTYNINYRFEKSGHSLSIDVDYGQYRTESNRFQPNRYFDAGEETLLTEVINTFDTPRDIDIYTFKADYEKKMDKSTLSFGTKLSKVSTDNTFLLFDRLQNIDILNVTRSNQFIYDESVYAGYVNYSGSLGENWNFSAGLRAEQTDATGDLRPFAEDLKEPPVNFDYLSWFPSAGLTYQLAREHSLSLNYGRRINRPDYNVLNPFNNQLSELSFEKGNPFLRPEIVNNIELGYTLKYRYNFKIGYSYTTDQITRLIGPSATDDRANFITWENLATQTILSANASLPIQITKKWNGYFNISGSHLDNQADYGDGAIVDVQAWTYNIFQQHTFDLPKSFKAEISGWFSGPGVWGGVFLYETSWSLNLGLQKKFFAEKLNAKLSASDLFYESGWNGVSEFNGLRSVGSGRWDSRRVSLSLSYNFGNQNVKARKRKTGLEDESKRVGS
ncbi:MAG: TonB dependent receptor [Saprospiraceae bacterium]|nr:TonB dependent receptor [Saprospiraceae bacterium]